MNYLRHDGTFGKRESSVIDWPPIRERMKELLASQLYSGNDLAIMLSGEFDVLISRNAIIGQIHRHGLGQLTNAGRPRNANPTPRKRIRHYVPKIKAEKPEPPLAEIDDLQIHTEQRCTLLQLNEHTCKFPIGDPLTPDFFFCGADKESENPYCAAHCRRAFNSEATRKSYKAATAKTWGRAA